MEEIVFLNGRFLQQSQARLPVVTPGLLYGWGLFETMRWHNNKIVYFDAHLKRIRDSSKLICISFPYSLAGFKRGIDETAKINGFSDARLRLALFKKSEKEADILVFAKKYNPFSPARYKHGFSCLVSSLRQNGNSFLANLKTTNYLLFQLAYCRRKKRI